MKVKDLIKQLEELNKPDAEITLLGNVGHPENDETDLYFDNLEIWNDGEETITLFVGLNTQNIEPIGTKVIELPIGGIVVTIDYDELNRPISGNIIHTDLKANEEEDELFNAAMDGILSLILAHAMGEIDITSNGYIEGLDTAIDSCANNL